MFLRARGWLLFWFATATTISAFLVFQVQPVISKMVLPWFGGSPAVWTTCMLFFQVLLLAGYCYAHLSTRWLTPKRQGALHFVLLLTALFVLPITPDASWKPQGNEHPAGWILLILAANVGLPYFLLSSTGPLLQAWYSRLNQQASPYRLYALSNVGSLAALLSYPLLVEPTFSTPGQGSIWSLGFCVFVLLSGLLAAGLGRWHSVAAAPEGGEAEAHCQTPPRGWHYLAWLLLPAFASVMLLATTNHVCQDIAVIPFLWVVPLSLYLLTFILCFDHPRWYSRRWCSALAVLAAISLSLMMHFRLDGKLAVELAAFFSTLFFMCMVSHGEFVRLRPHPRYLTAFYLMCSAGGALGGVTVAVVCPLVFPAHFEMNLAVLAGGALAMFMLLRDAEKSWLGNSGPRQRIAALSYFAVFLFVGLVQFDAMEVGAACSIRNFYGVLRVSSPEEGRGTTLIHGRTVHGFQFRHPRLHRTPTTYYGPQSGAGLTLRRLGDTQPLRVGAVGLGCGTIAAYGRAQDSFRFYEINPAVVQLARDQFSFLDDCPANCDVVLGDARLSLEREKPQNFDVLVLDAFSSDSVPTHLLTREAFRVYRRHLKKDGVIAVHVSNRHLRLDPVVLRLAEDCQMTCVFVHNRADPLARILDSKWMLMTNNPAFLSDEQIQTAAVRLPKRQSSDVPLWTDQYNNLFEIMQLF